MSEPHRSYTEADLELARKWVLPHKNKPLASEVALLIADVSRAATIEVEALRARTEKAEWLAKHVEKRRAKAVAWAKDLELRLRGVIRGLETLRQNPPFDVKTFVGHLIESYAERMDREELIAFIGTFDVDEEIVMESDEPRPNREPWWEMGVRPAATSWEYLVVLVERRTEYAGALSNEKPTHTSVAKELARLGSLGWELVQVVDVPEGTRLYMKMPTNKPIAADTWNR